MRGIKTLCILFSLMLASFAGWAQRYFTSFEVGISGGVSQYFGDLNEHYGLKTPNFAAGIYGRERLNSYIAVKLGAYYTQVGYDDKLENIPYQQLRNLNFKSDIVEISAQAEFNFFAFITGDKEHRFTPYLTGGLGMFHYDPYTTYNGKKYFLRPLGTEGQYAGFSDRKYTTTALCFPIGAGVKWWIKGGVNLTIELADRLTTTDYLDDVSNTYVGSNKFSKNPVARALQDRSGEVNNIALGRAGKQRGNTASKDQYFMALISLSFNFTSYKCPSFMRNDDELRIR